MGTISACFSDETDRDSNVYISRTWRIDSASKFLRRLVGLPASHVFLDLHLLQLRPIMLSPSCLAVLQCLRSFLLFSFTRYLLKALPFHYMPSSALVGMQAESRSVATSPTCRWWHLADGRLRVQGSYGRRVWARKYCLAASSSSGDLLSRRSCSPDRPRRLPGGYRPSRQDCGLGLPG